MLLRDTVAGSATPFRHHDMTMYTGDGSRGAGGGGGTASAMTAEGAMVGAAGGTAVGVGAGLCSKISTLTGAATADAWDLGSSRLPGSTSMARRPSPKQTQNNHGVVREGSSSRPMALVPMVATHAGAAGPPAGGAAGVPLIRGRAWARFFWGE